MITVVYFVRHATPYFGVYDDITRALTEEGLRDRKLATAFLWDKGVEAVLSSPCKRAYDTVKDFADAKGLPIEVVDDFRERRVGVDNMADYESFRRRQWEDFDYKMPAGESLREVQRRNVRALAGALARHPGKTLAVGTHGIALSMLINHFDPTYGWADFDDMKGRMPWLVQFTFAGSVCREILTYDLFAPEKPPCVRNPAPAAGPVPEGA